MMSNINVSEIRAHMKQLIKMLKGAEETSHHVTPGNQYMYYLDCSKDSDYLMFRFTQHDFDLCILNDRVSVSFAETQDVDVAGLLEAAITDITNMVMHYTLKEAS